MRAIIIDDKPFIVQTIANIISTQCPTVEVVAQANNVKTGVESIRQHKPDLVFLDIRMPDGTGFDLLEQVKDLQFRVIFVTAYEEYAVKAFRFSAIDYILKPIDPDDLIQAIQKAEKLIQSEARISRETFVANKDLNPDEKRLILRTSDRMYVVKVSEIIRCASSGNYTEFFLKNGQKLLVSKPLKDYEELLTEFHFYRVHHSHLINLRQISHFEKPENCVIMSDQSNVPVSSRKKEEFLNVLDKL